MKPDEHTVFKALADASRRNLPDRLFKKNGQILSELCSGQDMTRQAVTRHLDLLEKANPVVTIQQDRGKTALSQSRSNT